MKVYVIPLGTICPDTGDIINEPQAVRAFIQCLEAYFARVKLSDHNGLQNGLYPLWVTCVDSNLWLVPWLVEQGELEKSALEAFEPLPDAEERLAALGKLLSIDEALNFIEKNLNANYMFSLRSMDCFSIHFIPDGEVSVVIPHEHSDFWKLQANAMLLYPITENDSLLTATDLLDF